MSRRRIGWERISRRLLPAWFVARWGREVSDLLEVERAAARRRGRGAVMAFHARTLWDLLRAARQTRRGLARRLWSELWLALRSLRRSPGFALACVLTFGLGTSVAAGMYSAIERAIVRPLPVDRPDALLRVHTLVPSTPEIYGLSPVDFTALATRADSLEAVSYYLPARYDLDILLQTEDGPERINGLRVAPDYFDVLGVRPAIGPGFSAAADAGPEIMLSHDTWLRRHGGDRNVLGTTLRLDRRPHAIVGVLPASFDVPFDGQLPEMWIARRLFPAELTTADNFIVDVTARLKPGRSAEEALTEIASIGAQSAAEQPGSMPNRHLTAASWAGELTSGWVAPLGLLSLAAAAVVIMACGSVSLLVLARQAARPRELAMWVALGASRSAMARRLLLEVGALAACGIALGLALAAWGSRALLALMPARLPRFDGLELDLPLLLFAVSTAAAAALLSALAPLLRLRRLAPADALRVGSQGTSASVARGQSLVIGLQCGLMTVLLIVLGLALVSFVRLQRVDPGFQTVARFTTEVGAPLLPYGQRREAMLRQARFFEALRLRLLAEPGIVAAGAVSNLPLKEGWSGQAWVRDQPLAPGTRPPVVDWEVAGAGYFRAAGVDVVSGREFEPADDVDGARVAVVNEAFAARHLDGRDPLGVSISDSSAEGPWRRIVGVVRDVRQQGLDLPIRPQMYIPLAQAFPFGKYQLVVSTRLATGVTSEQMRNLVREVSTDAVAGPLRPLEDLVAASTASSRLSTWLVGIFAGLAVVLALTGTWGVMSLVGRSRRHELAVRGALGASRHQLISAAARSGLGPVAAGLGIGVAAAVAISSWLAGHLYGLAPFEPGVLTGALAVLVPMTSLAVAIPARRAARVDPAAVFRS